MSLSFSTFTVQRVHLHHSVQHSLLHECKELALDEAFLQDKAFVKKRRGRERDADNEGGVRSTQRGVCQVGGQEEGAGGEDGDARPGEERPVPANPSSM